MDPLPIWFRHPMTGVRVKVDKDGITTFAEPGPIGVFRSFTSMRDVGGQAWSAAREIEMLDNHYWKRI
jgi:hypothetical protein